MKEILKAGCFLVDIKNRRIGLIYREQLDDYSFPKGHLEENETLEECAVRETAEETKRDCIIVKDIKPYIHSYQNKYGNCKVYMYVAIDVGKSDNASTDTHDLVWTDFDKVEEVLSYQNLKDAWKYIKKDIVKLF